MSKIIKIKYIGWDNDSKKVLYDMWINPDDISQINPHKDDMVLIFFSGKGQGIYVPMKEFKKIMKVKK